MEVQRGYKTTGGDTLPLNYERLSLQKAHWTLTGMTNKEFIFGRNVDLSLL